MRTPSRTIVFPGVSGAGGNPRPARGLYVPIFVLTGIVATIGIAAIAEHHGGALALLAVIAVPMGITLLVFAGVRLLTPARDAARRRTWWHVLWLLLFASALVFQQRSVSDIRSNPLNGWALYRVALDAAIAAVLFTRLALRRPAWFGSMFRGVIGALSIYSLVCLASTVWSVYPAWTAFKSLEYILGIAAIAAIVEVAVSIERFESLFNWTWVLYGLLLLSVWFGAILWPQEALYGAGFKVGMIGARLTGVVPAQSADGVGMYAAMLGLVALARLLPISGGRRRTLWYVFLLVASMTTLVLSQTRMAIGGFLLGALLLLYFSKRLRPGSILGLATLSLALLGAFGPTLWTYLKRGQNSQQLGSLSSRLTWWAFAWHKFLERPLTGYGAYAGARFAVLAKIGMSTTASLHSDFLEVIVGSGVWGLAPFVAALVGTWWYLIRYLRHSSSEGPERQLAYESVAILALLTINSFLLPMLTWQAPLYFLVIVCYAEFLRRRQAAASLSSSLRRRNLPVEVIAHGTPA